MFTFFFLIIGLHPDYVDPYYGYPPMVGTVRSQRGPYVVTRPQPVAVQQQPVKIQKEKKRGNGYGTMDRMVHD